MNTWASKLGITIGWENNRGTIAIVTIETYEAKPVRKTGTMANIIIAPLATKSNKGTIILATVK